MCIISSKTCTLRKKWLKSSNSQEGNNSHANLAMELMFENPEYVMLNQSANPANPEIHRQTTAREILDDFNLISLDYFIAGIGTGGHITGIGEVIKNERPNVEVIGVQPEGCDILNRHFVPHKIQGLSVGILPRVLNVDIIDKMLSVSYDDACRMMLLMMRKEGISVGISTGANIAAAIRIASDVKPGSNILTMAYDGASDYVDDIGDI